MRMFLAAVTMLSVWGCVSPDQGDGGTTAGSASAKPHCDELQALGDKCCGLGFKGACGSVSKDFTDSRCNESLDKLKNKCSNYECSWSDDACFQ